VYSDKLLYEIKTHYFREREATILLISAILRAADYELHPCHANAKLAVKKLMEKQSPSFPELVFQQFMRVSSASLPETLLSHQDQLQAVEWTTANLKEQKALLDLLVLIYYHKDRAFCSQMRSKAIIEGLLKNSLGTNQLNRSYFDAEGIQVYHKINHITAVLILEIFYFEDLLNMRTISDLECAEPDSLLGSPEVLLNITELIWQAKSKPGFASGPNAFGVVSLAWGCYCQYLLTLFQEWNATPSAYQSFAESCETSCHAQYLLQYGYSKAHAIQFLCATFGEHGILSAEPNEIAFKVFERLF
jgi:hypothetical protein